MAASSVTSDVFFSLALVAISLLVLLLLRFYLPLRSTPAYLLVPVFLALALPLSIILLVPIDLASSSGSDADGARGIWLPERAILVFWRISYWLTFLLTWIALPLLGDYIDSGYREPKDRLIYSLRTNGKYQLIALTVGIIVGAYLIVSTGFSGATPKALLIALAYTWGLIMAVYLMGHGLVAIPRRLYRNARTQNRLQKLQAHAPKVHDKLLEANEELSALEGQVAQLRSARATLRPDLKDWLDEVVETTVGTGTQPRGSAFGSTSTPAVVTERYLAELARKLKRARHKTARFDDEWERLVDKARDLQAVIDAAGSQQLVFARKEGERSYSFVTPYMRYHIYTHGLPALRLGGAAFLALASVVLIWSEIMRTLLKSKTYLSVVGLTVVHHSDTSKGQIGFGGQVIAGLWLLYMCFAALYSMSEVKVWGNRALVKRQTYGESACWYSLQVAKLTVPLSYNFITMLPDDIYMATSFYNFLGKLIDLTAIGRGFSDYFPLFILLPVCATLFNLYGKVQGIFGFGVLDDDSEENASGFGGWREGKILIERELRDRGDGVGLATPDRGYSSRSSLDTSRGANAGRAPLLMPLGNAASGRTSPRPDAPRAPRPRVEPEDEDDSPRFFFQDFGERVKNTLDTVDKPKWLSDLGNGITKPKWMQREESGEGSNPWARMFSNNRSSSSDGRIRL